MLEGTPITAPVQYGYLLLAAVLVLIACIAGITWIIRETYKNTTSEPDYLGYWKKLHDLQKAPIKPHQTEDAVGHYYPDDNDRTVHLPTPNYDNQTTVFFLPHSDVIMPGSGSEKRNASNIYQSLTKPPFCWETFLDDLIKDCCTPSQIDKAKFLSAHFQTCPAGQVHPDIPREEEGEPGQPKDEHLCRLGAEFWRALNLDEYTRANDIYHQIKAREKQLLNLLRSLSAAEGSGSEG